MNENPCLVRFMILIVRSRRSHAYEPLLLENEREAVADLLQYLDSEYLLLGKVPRTDRNPGLLFHV